MDGFRRRSGVSEGGGGVSEAGGGVEGLGADVKSENVLDSVWKRSL